MLISLTAVGRTSRAVAASPTVEFVYHSLVPLGSEAFSLPPGKTVLTILASAENPQFAGWRSELYQQHRSLVDAAGRPVRYYPDHVDFRVTLSTRAHMIGDEPFPINTGMPLNDYLQKVSFRMKVFHGLRQRIVPAASVAMIGVPADIPSEERIYRVSFDLGEISMRDRIVLEVLSPTGERLCKFHLDL